MREGGWPAVVDSCGELASCVYPNWAALETHSNREAARDSTPRMSSQYSGGSCATTRMRAA